MAIKKRLLENHRLRAVISMPDQLFYPGVEVVTCIMVWEANKPNEDFDTWFGYLKVDGFEKRKNKGRIDAKKKWNKIKSDFLKAYKGLLDDVNEDLELRNRVINKAQNFTLRLQISRSCYGRRCTTSGQKHMENADSL